jgi:phage tail-like protein
MATTASNIRTDYPIPIYHFNVHFGDADVAFSEVSGLEMERQAITYRNGLGFIHMPGMEQPVKLTLKRGIMRSDSTLYAWINSVNLNTVDKKNITISLIDDESKPVVSWKVLNVFPVKFSVPTFDAKSNEVAIESLELMADSFKVEYA